MNLLLRYFELIALFSRYLNWVYFDHVPRATRIIIVVLGNVDLLQ